MGVRLAAVIPARFASSRFPGKALADIAGLPMVVRVARRVQLAKSIDDVLVATDDERIAKATEAAKIRTIMTPAACASGTDRVARAVDLAGLTDADLIVNVQGDEPLIDPLDIDALATETFEKGASMGTLARPFDDLQQFADPNLVKVVATARGRALYFSRAPIPAGRGVSPLLHVGIYAYRPDVLRALADAPPSPLEKAERLEQLRAFELDIDIHVAMARSEHPSIAVDTPEDVERVLNALNGNERK